jgi:hypothetical protein
MTRFYIMTTCRSTYTKYLIEREGDTPLGEYDGEYIGYVDGETDSHTYSEAFETKEAALQHDDAYTEGR